MTSSEDKLQRVVGVSYEAGELAPTVVLKGVGDVAATLLAEARRAPHGPAVVRDAGLVDQLYRIPIDAPIGRELFPVMATLLAHVLQLDHHLNTQPSGVKT